MIVAIEGIDAAGKNTAVERLCEWFKTNLNTTFGNDIRKHDFPHYETTAGGVVGRILRGQTIIVDENDIERDDMSPVTLAEKWSRDKAVIIQSVMICDRLEWLPLLVEYAQSPHNLLLLDRFKVSGVAYGAADGLEASWIRTVQSCIPDADLNVLIDITVDESRKRRPERRDFYEKQFDKLHRARGYYLAEYNRISASDASSSLVVSGDQDREKIALQIVEAILQKQYELELEQKVTIES